MKSVCLALIAAAASQAAFALNADDLRGGWQVTDKLGPHVLELKIRGSVVSGVYCTDCSDAATIAFVGGNLGPKGLTFEIDHLAADGTIASKDHLTATLEGENLSVRGQSDRDAAGAWQWLMHKDPRGPAAVGAVAVAALPQPGAPPSAVAAYGKDGQPFPQPASPPSAAAAAAPALPPAWMQPGPWESLSDRRLVGTWIAGTGPNKQYFTIRRVGKQLLGLVCGDCSNPYTMALLDGFVVEGDTLRFNICHEDWGFGKMPFHNVVTAKLARNELRILSFQADNQPPQPARAGGAMSAIGPLVIGSSTAR